MTTPFDPSEWPTSTDYLYGVDLFNYCYWWEAHEVWERIWVAVGRQTPMGQFMQGLIQISVALLKRFQGLSAAAHRLQRQGFARMGRSPGTFVGIEVALFERAVGAYFTGARATPPVIDLVSINGDGTFRNGQRAKNKRNSGA